jgi:hypothetical protein
LHPISPKEAAEKIKRHSLGPALGWSLIVPIITIPVAVGASVGHTHRVNKRILQDVSNKALTELKLFPGDTTRGVVFFSLPGKIEIRRHNGREYSRTVYPEELINPRLKIVVDILEAGNQVQTEELFIDL